MPPEAQRPPRRVSVIVPAYRAATTIGRALASVADQSFRPDEVIVVDDGSDDGTAAAAAACRGVLGPVELRVVAQANAGAGAARNRGMAEARGNYLAFLDADDEWLPEHLESSMEIMDSGGHVLTAHNEWIVDGSAEALNDCARRFREGLDPYVSLYRKGYISTSTVVIRNDGTGPIVRFDETLANAQDFEFWLSFLRDRSATFRVFDAPLARYHVMADSIMRHTKRRLDCCRVIAIRHCRSLRGRPGFPLWHFWYRMAAIYMEAWNAFHRTKDRAGQVRLAAGLVPDLLISTVAVVARGLDNSPMTEETHRTTHGAPLFGRPAAVLCWAWTVGVLGAYLFQLRHLFDAILARLGIG